MLRPIVLMVETISTIHANKRRPGKEKLHGAIISDRIRISDRFFLVTASG